MNFTKINLGNSIGKPSMIIPAAILTISAPITALFVSGCNKAPKPIKPVAGKKNPGLTQAPHITSAATTLPSIDLPPSKIAQMKSKVLSIWDAGQDQYFKELNVDSKDSIFISDPSQGNNTVSEGQPYWMLIASGLAKVDTPKASFYQEKHDSFMNGYLAMVALAQQDGNNGNLAAWAVKINGGQLSLNNDKPGPSNSAADADLDFIRGLISAQENVDAGLWKDHGYSDLIDKYLSAVKNLFQKVGTTYTMLPSEDWSDFYFIDYHAPGTCFEIADWLKAQGRDSEAAFWQEAGMGSFTVLIQSIIDTHNIPAQADINAGDGSDPLDVEQRQPQGWDGIRGPWRLALGLKNIDLSEDEKAALLAFLRTRHRYTNSVLDAAMYLPLAAALGQNDDMDALLDTVLSSDLDPNKYYENSLIALSLLEFLNHKIAVNTTGDENTAAVEARDESAVQPAEENANSSPATPEKVNLPSAISSQWGKDAVYSVAGNILTVQGTGAIDADMISFGTLDTNGHNKLVLKIKSISGNFTWGEKVFGLSINGNTDAPAGKTVSDDFINGPLKAGDRLVYDISGNSITLDMKVYVASGVSYKIEFTLE
ncbi:MAG: hypothetical protein V1843_00365 [bacterium]